jgi:hypothetical protein
VPDVECTVRAGPSTFTCRPRRFRAVRRPSLDVHEADASYRPRHARLACGVLGTLRLRCLSPEPFV